MKTIVLAACLTCVTQAQPKGVLLPLTSIAGIQPSNAKLTVATHAGRSAVQILPLPGHENSNENMLALLDTPVFRDGEIELDVSGNPRPGSDPTSRGFIGIAFRVQPQGAKYECIYLRPTNARADDQLQRNHTVQYVSAPDFPWERLRKETPGVYESYFDMQPGVWTHVRIVVSGVKARLYVNRAAEPCLVINGLKLGESEGRIALWSHTSTDGYFSNLKIQ